MSTPCVIFDIDGTLSLTDHRQHFLQDSPKDWDGFFDAMVDDQPNEPIVDLLKTLAEGGAAITLMTGRPSSHKDQTYAWLESHGIQFDALYMRETNDYRADSVVKAEMLSELRRYGYEPWLVVDDRQSVVDMWRAEGLTCLQCAEGDF